MKKSKKLKILQSLSEASNQELIKRNWRLVYLDVNNLVHKQTQKIDEKVENSTFTVDNMGAHKLLNEHGIINIDLFKAKMLFRNFK